MAAFDYIKPASLESLINDYAQAKSEGVYYIHTGEKKSAYQSTPQVKGNECYQTKLSHGDILEGFKRSEVIVEETYFMPRQEHTYLETEAGVAYNG